MIFKKALETLDETPLEIQRALTDICEIKHKNKNHYEDLENFKDIKDLKTKNKILSNVIKTEKQVETRLKHLLNVIDSNCRDFDSELASFRENCAASAMSAKATMLDDVLNSKEVFCICRKGSTGKMIACDNDDCETEWFHISCVGLLEPPEGKWVCSKCQKKE